MMTVARLFGVGDLRVVREEVPDDIPTGHSLVRVTAVGLCGSDLHWFAEGGIGDAVLARPLVLGHEFAGVVEQGPLAGARVAVDPAIPCGTCPSCVAGHPNLCPTVRFAGHGSQDGGLQERLVWPDRMLHPLPDEISDAGGAMLEPLGIAIHSFDLGHVRVGSTVAIVGCGPIGLLAVQLARAAGATSILAVEPLPHRRQAALSMGADVALSPAEARSACAAAEAGADMAAAEVAAGSGSTRKFGFDVAFEIAGNDDAVGLAMDLVRPGARVVLAGIPDNDRTSFSASVARRKGLSILLVRRMKDVYPRAIGLVRRGLVDVESVVTDRFPLADAAAAFATAVERRALKTVVEVSTQ
jgi:L-iditol 2-dehydrogenase